MRPIQMDRLDTREPTLSTTMSDSWTPYGYERWWVPSLEKRLWFRYDVSFFLFGLLNNVLYVVILSAALDLVPSQSVPKGVILFFNITPALLCKLFWPYLFSGKIIYSQRIISCCLVSFLGMLLVSLSSSLSPRLIGISAASFSSGLGEMTFLQLSATYHTVGPRGVGWFSSGTGGAGLVGAGGWWFLRQLGPRLGLGVCTILPIWMGAIYFFIIPSSLDLGVTQFSGVGGGGVKGNYEPVAADPGSSVAGEREGLLDEAEEDEPKLYAPKLVRPLTLRRKIELVKPLFGRYMLPLFLVYLAEYTINTGCSPNFLYPLPSPASLWGKIIQTLRDYYVFWQLDYQFFVFLSRSSISIFRLPPLPRSLIPLPTGIQCVLLVLAILESWTGWITSVVGQGNAPLTLVAGLVAIEGLCGGTMYIATYYWVGKEESTTISAYDLPERATLEDETIEEEIGKDADEEEEREYRRREKEFRMGCVGVADTLGIVAASAISGVLEGWLCSLQVKRGLDLCRQV